ncbi:MAG: S24/S26 family peptidase [Bacteroidaceae bacterium]|nr:S24/S26 family peptidase [Bacteroidaceae bacterium]
MKTLRLPNEEFMPVLFSLMQEEGGASGTMTARGQSMMPFIRHNKDLLRFTLDVDVRLGDVVLAEVAKGHYVCHRVVSLQGDRLTMRGDGNLVGVEHCRLADVRARLQAVVRDGKTYDLRTSRTWKLYSALWPRWSFLRRVLLAFYRATHGMPLLARNVSLD